MDDVTGDPVRGQKRHRQPLLPSGPHVVDGLQVELGEDALGRLRADPLQPHDGDGAGRVAIDQARERGDLSRRQQLGHLVGDGLADARQGRQAALSREPRHRLGRLPQRRGGPAVGEDPVDHRPLELEQVSQELEPLCYSHIGERRRFHGANASVAGCPTGS